MGRRSHRRPRRGSLLRRPTLVAGGLRDKGAGSAARLSSRSARSSWEEPSSSQLPGDIAVGVESDERWIAQADSRRSVGRTVRVLQAAPNPCSVRRRRGGHTGVPEERPRARRTGITSADRLPLSAAGIPAVAVTALDLAVAPLPYQLDFVPLGPLSSHRQSFV